VFYLLNYTSNAVLIPAVFILESETVPIKCRLQPGHRIDEKERVIEEVFLAEFGKEHLGNRLIPPRRGRHVRQAVRIGVDRVDETRSGSRGATRLSSCRETALPSLVARLVRTSEREAF